MTLPSARERAAVMLSALSIDPLMKRIGTRGLPVRVDRREARHVRVGDAHLFGARASDRRRTRQDLTVVAQEPERHRPSHREAGEVHTLFVDVKRLDHASHEVGEESADPDT
jgi:hypothetical protein